MASGPLLRAIDAMQWYTMLQEILFLIGQIDDVSEECYYALEDTCYKYYKWARYGYHDGEVLFNAALNIGSIANDITGIVLYFSNDLPWAGPSGPQQVGKLFGDIIASFLNNPKYKAGVNMQKTTD